MTTPSEPERPQPPPGLRQPQRQRQPSRGLTEVLGRALVDEQFRNRLLSDRAGTAREFGLSQPDLEALESIPPEQLIEHAERFTAGSATATTVGVSVKGTF